ncbi:MAG: type II secretion system protein, partial [Gemmataceae bacterium]
MLCNRLPREVRRGFTLIELLVVIAIIAVLVGLTSAAVLRVLFKGPEIQAQSEIQQLAAAISAFKQEFNVKTMPSRIVLREDMNSYINNDKLEEDSRAFLGMMFGRRLQNQIDWNNDGTIQTGPAGRYELTGEQCLVFFLGGAKNTTPPGVRGFSSSPTNPMQPGGTRRGPFYDFKSNRLRPAANGFFVYLDPFDPPQGVGRKAYVYLSDYSTNVYSKYGSSDSAQTVQPNNQPVQPYKLSPSQFVNPGSFQIISAGADGRFGDSTMWTPTQGSSDPQGRD